LLHHLKKASEILVVASKGGKKYATNSTPHDWMFAPRSPPLVPPGRFLVPKPVRVREARMQNWDDNHAARATDVMTLYGRYQGEHEKDRKQTFGELFFSSDVDARMQRQMI
jgi:hypothetical protein